MPARLVLARPDNILPRQPPGSGQSSAPRHRQRGLRCRRRSGQPHRYQQISFREATAAPAP